MLNYFKKTLLLQTNYVLAGYGYEGPSLMHEIKDDEDQEATLLTRQEDVKRRFKKASMFKDVCLDMNCHCTNFVFM